MLKAYSDAQLLARAHEISQWARVRAQELYYFTHHLPGALAAAQGDPERIRTQLFAFRCYVDGLQEQVDHARGALAELERRYGGQG